MILRSRERRRDGTPANPTPVENIVHLGTSLTQGAGGESQAGYRKRLYDELKTLGCHFRFVGTQTDPTPAFAEPFHDGFSGALLTQLHAEVTQNFGPGKAIPDARMVIVQAGFPDLLGGYNATVASSFTTLCDLLYGKVGARTREAFKARLGIRARSG